MMETRLPDAKKNWPDGPWMTEPDRKQWFYRGQYCLILRNPIGALCGYAGVPPDSPFFGKNYHEDGMWKRFSPHGGLTFSGEKNDITNKKLWWLGFDCAHGGDFAPGAFANIPLSIETFQYRDIDYVTLNVEGLVDEILHTTETENLCPMNTQN